jgi:hypothetical protein
VPGQFWPAWLAPGPCGPHCWAGLAWRLGHSWTGPRPALRPGHCRRVERSRGARGSRDLLRRHMWHQQLGRPVAWWLAWRCSLHGPAAGRRTAEALPSHREEKGAGDEERQGVVALLVARIWAVATNRRWVTGWTRFKLSQPGCSLDRAVNGEGFSGG